MEYAIFTTTGESPTFKDIFESGKLVITVDKDIETGIVAFIIKPEEGDEILISLKLPDNRLTGGKKNKLTKKPNKKNKLNKKTNKKNRKNKNRNTRKKNKKSYVLRGGNNLKKGIIFVIFTLLINYIMLPINLNMNGIGETGRRVSDGVWKDAQYSREEIKYIEEALDNVEIKIGKQLTLEDVNIDTLGTIRPSNRQFDIIRATNSSKFGDFLKDGKKIAVATINNKKTSPTYQLTNLMPQLTYPGNAVNWFGGVNRFYVVTSQWKIDRTTNKFDIDLYNTTNTERRSRNLSENKDIDALVKATINEQLTNSNLLGMIPDYVSEGWGDVILLQIPTKTPALSLYHFDGHQTFRDHDLIQKLVDEHGPSHFVKYSSEYSHLIPINETTYLANPASAIQTMTYASGSDKDRARIKMIDGEETDIKIKGEGGEMTAYLDQSTGVQHRAESGNTLPFPLTGGDTRYLMLFSIMPKVLDTQTVDPKIYELKRN